MVESAAMVKPYRPGVEARQRILYAIRSAEDRGERVTLDMLAARLDYRRATVAYHVGTLRKAGLLTTRRGPVEGSIALTVAGRIATD